MLWICNVMPVKLRLYMHGWQHITDHEPFERVDLGSQIRLLHANKCVGCFGAPVEHDDTS